MLSVSCFKVEGNPEPPTCEILISTYPHQFFIVLISYYNSNISKVWAPP